MMVSTCSWFLEPLGSFADKLTPGKHFCSRLGDLFNALVRMMALIVHRVMTEIVRLSCPDGG